VITRKRNTPNALLVNSNSILTRALAQCRADEFADAGSVQNEDIHARKGNCGEIMASALHLGMILVASLIVGETEESLITVL
jgi:hypothetical protein